MFGGALLSFGLPEYGFETRVAGMLYTVSDFDTKISGGVALLHGTRWWRVYGLGFGGGVGYADFQARTLSGWSGSGPQLLSYLAPVMLRFGRAPTFEVGAHIGAALYFAHDLRSYGSFYGALLF